MKVLLMGNPNVGKSVVFSRLTGTNVTSSNYSGTTVEFTEGYLKWRDQQVKIIDVPGTYTLEPTNEAEEVAVKMLDEGDLVLNVVDATNLERNLNLTLQLLERDIPVMVLLNLWDETQHKGIKVDVEHLEEILGVPVIPTIATRGHGFSRVLDRLGYRKVVNRSYGSREERWVVIGNIIQEVQTIEHRHHTWLDIVEEKTIQPLSGIPIAIIVLFCSFKIIRFIGEGFINYLADPFFLHLYKPLMVQLSILLGKGGFIHDLLIGKLINGDVNFEQSFGLLTTGIYIPFSAVLPYIIAFYLILGFLEDTGYLPRLAVLVDNVMHKVGLHGFSIIPMILGFGCNVPAALAARTLDSPREKFIASTLMAISIPCMAQTAMIIGLLGPHGTIYIGYVFVVLVAIWIIVGLILNKIMPGFSSDLLIEIPSFRIPSPGIVLKKLWMRIFGFLHEAVPYVLIGVLVVNLLYILGIFDLLTVILGPVLNFVFGLPEKAISALLMGFLRKDLAMGMLVPLHLSVKQLVIASTILTVYFPCAATFMVLMRELGIINMIKATGIMLTTTIIIGGFMNLTFYENGITIIIWLAIITGVLLFKYSPLQKRY